MVGTATMVAANTTLAAMHIMAVTPMDTRMVIITDVDQPKKKNAPEITNTTTKTIPTSPTKTIQTTRKCVKFNAPGRRFRAVC